MNIQYNERKYIAIYLWQINDIEKIWVTIESTTGHTCFINQYNF